MKNTENIFRSVVGGALVVLFTAFNVGLPIALYVCPMMSGSASACTCGCTPDSPAFTYESGCCCNTALLAERNTVPFIAAEKYFSQEAASFCVVIGNAALESHTHGATLLLSQGNALSPPQAIPIYLQSSALLI